MLPENNYLYFVVRDENQKIRANIIGTQHSVDRSDKRLNSEILHAVKRSSKAILEILPGSRLIPPIPSPEWVIGREIEPLKQDRNDFIDSPNISNEIETILKDIEEKTDSQDYKKVIIALEEIPSNKNKLIFVEAIQKNISEFNEVSLEENINKLIIENNVEYAPLEDIDLAELLIQAQKENIPEELPQLNEKVDEKEELKLKKEELRKQAIKNELYSAWKKGDTLELSKLLDECHELYKEPPEIAKIHAPRDENMAKRIVEVVKKVKEEDKEALIVLGCAHLLYSKRKNVIEFLNDRFTTDLKGWSITQVKF